jgi:hypothetical protein
MDFREAEVTGKEHAFTGSRKMSVWLRRDLYSLRNLAETGSWT